MKNQRSTPNAQRSTSNAGQHVTIFDLQNRSMRVDDAGR